MKIFKVRYEYRVKGIAEWMDDQTHALANDAETAIKKVKKDALAYIFEDAPDQTNVKNVGKKTVMRKATGFRLVSVECLATADM